MQITPLAPADAPALAVKALIHYSPPSCITNASAVPVDTADLRRDDLGDPAPGQGLQALR
jgi:hypothetical protein